MESVNNPLGKAFLACRKHCYAHKSAVAAGLLIWLKNALYKDCSSIIISTLD
jgi:hypothetical protein